MMGKMKARALYNGRMANWRYHILESEKGEYYLVDHDKFILGYVFPFLRSVTSRNIFKINLAYSEVKSLIERGNIQQNDIKKRIIELICVFLVMGPPQIASLISTFMEIDLPVYLRLLIGGTSIISVVILRFYLSKLFRKRMLEAINLEEFPCFGAEIYSDLFREFLRSICIMPILLGASLVMFYISVYSQGPFNGFNLILSMMFMFVLLHTNTIMMLTGHEYTVNILHYKNMEVKK